MVGREVHAVSRVARSEVDATIHGASAPALRVQDLVVEREGTQWVRRVSLEVPWAGSSESRAWLAMANVNWWLPLRVYSRPKQVGYPRLR